MDQILGMQHEVMNKLIEQTFKVGDGENNSNHLNLNINKEEDLSSKIPIRGEIQRLTKWEKSEIQKPFIIQKVEAMINSLTRSSAGALGGIHSS